MENKRTNGETTKSTQPVAGPWSVGRVPSYKRFEVTCFCWARGLASCVGVSVAESNHRWKCRLIDLHGMRL